MEKRKIRFNIIDVVVILAIIAVGYFAYTKLSAGELANENRVKYRMTFYTEESPEYAIEKIASGNPVCEESNNEPLGTVVAVEINDESQSEVITDDGRILYVHKPGYKSGTITFEGEGYEFAYGAKFGDCKYGVGQTVTLRMGPTKMYGRIKNIEVIK